MEGKPIIAGNWKMHKTTNEGSAFAMSVQNILVDIKNVSVVFSPPFIGLFELEVESPFFKAAQNCHWEDHGAFTGEISTSMIKSCGAEFVIIGHSERRQYFGDSNKWINKKIKSVLAEELNPIFCIGETLDERESGKTEERLRNQIVKGLDGLKDLNKIVIAYEPVWAIGTGKTANNLQIREAHSYIKKVIKGLYPSIQDIQVLYGGSVKPSNAGELICVPHVDGFLIGGASLDVDSFSSIVQIVEDIQENK